MPVDILNDDQMMIGLDERSIQARAIQIDERRPLLSGRIIMHRTTIQFPGFHPDASF